MNIRDFENLLEEYKRRGYTLKNRISPQPSESGSFEQKVFFAIVSCESITIPKNDPIYLALSFIFNDKEWTRWSLWFLTYQRPKGIFENDLEEIFYSLEIYYGSSRVYTHLRQCFSFDEATGTLKYENGKLSVFY